MGQLQSLASRGADIQNWLAAEGLIFTASDAAQDDLVTGQTSFAATTPTFLVDVPAGTCCIPSLISLHQTGTVAGGAINIIIEKDNASRYASDGTAEAMYNDRGKTGLCTLYSGATAGAGYGIRLFGATVGQDVSPAEGAVNEVLWVPGPSLDLIVGPGAFLIYTYAETPGPSWFWTIKWGEVPSNWLD